MAQFQPVDNFGENDAHNWGKVNGNWLHRTEFASRTFNYSFMINNLLH
jgi:hypothetical protein